MLELRDLTKTYASFRLGPLDLRVGEEVLAVLGPSGCGKTTLLSLLAGIVTPEAGSIVLDGTRLDGRPPERRGTVLVFQEGALFPHMTVRENVEYAAAPGAEIDELAATLAIEDVLDRKATTLSGGETQRAALARALAADPDALLLDEPLANLDAPIKRRLRDDLRGLLSPLSIPVVYVTHDQTEASSIGDRIAVMRDGAFQQIGTPMEVFDRPATPFVASFTGSANVFRARVKEGGALRFGSYRLDAGAAGVDPGEEVWFCVRPEYVEVAEETGESVDGMTADVERCVFEGGTYRLALEPDGVDAVLEATVLPSTYERHGLAEGRRVSVHLPRGAIHVIDAVEDAVERNS